MNHYERLGLPRDAGAREVARAYRDLARRTHPDRGGNAAEFAAVAEAHRVLSDAALRAEYDRVLDGAEVDWDDVGWGAAVGDDAGQGAVVVEDVAVAPPASWDADGGPGRPDSGRPGRPGGDADAPASGPRRPRRGVLDPFVGPPLRIPDPLNEPPVVVSLPPGRDERLASVLAGALTIAASVLMVLSAVGAAEPVMIDDGGDGPVATVVAWLAFLGLAVLLHATSAPRTPGDVWAWIVTAGAAGLPFQVARPGAPPVAAVAVSVAPIAVAGAVVWARLLRRRRSDPRRVEALLWGDRRWLLDRFHRAGEWNVVRGHLLRPGTCVVAVGPAAAGWPCVPGTELRWTWDPRTGAQVVRLVPAGTPQGWWLVIDDEDRVVASAPAGSPEAWLSALRRTVPAPDRT